MDDISINITSAANETIRNYMPESPECISLQSKLTKMENELYEIPIIIGGKEIHTGNKGICCKPHDHQDILAEYHKSGHQEVQQAIDISMDTWHSWSNTP